MISVLHVATQVGFRSMGIGTVTRGLAEAQKALGAEVEIWSCDKPEEDVRTSSLVRRYPWIGPERFSLSPAMLARLAGRTGAGFEVCHQHSLWTMSSLASTAFRGRYRRPTIIAPQGSLSAWALAKSAAAKRWAYRLFEHRNLTSAACLQAVSELELGEIRALGLRPPVAIIPNGVGDDWLQSVGDPERFRARHSLPADGPLMLFLSRVTPKKGLPTLLRALASLPREREGWLLLIVGPDEFGHEAELRALADQLQLTPAIRFLGPLRGQEKRDAYAAADLFVLPTHSEGAPMAVLEALACAVPVLTTHGAPCRNISDHACGWWVPVDEGSIREALADALSCSDEQRRAMGQRGRRLVEDRYTWTRMATLSLAVYDWLLGRGPRPEHVVLA